MVIPRLVYVSLSSECGTVYTKAELSAISVYCRENGLYLFLDGARLGAALNSAACDLSYSDIAGLVDAFYIGGTKNGALFGEAIVICNDELKADFRFHLKQRGAMLAKGAAIGVQFEALLRDGLFDELALHANAMAMKMADGIRELGFVFLHPAETNLLIPVFPARVAEVLHNSYEFYDWQKSGDITAVRIVTSWATPESVIDDFLADLGKLKIKT
jgi:threonine aldolase